MNISIFTPTYNRKKLLRNLYDSLLIQTDMRFEWLIIDDGSSDGTEEQVREWIKDNKIRIHYKYQNNSGKISAMKNAIMLCENEWLICVDSDDLLTNEAVEIMYKHIDNGLNTGSIGFIFPRKFNNNNCDNWIPKEVCSIDIMDSKSLYGITETTILHRVDCLKLVEFPEFKGEKFLSESVIYNQLIKYGKYDVKNDVFYIAEYQESGITKNLFRHWVDNPNGKLFSLNLQFDSYNKYPFFIRIRERSKAIMDLNALCMEINEPVFRYSPSKFYSIVLYMPSIVWRELRFASSRGH